MLKPGTVVEGAFRLERLLLDDGLAAYWSCVPVGPDAPKPPPVLLLRAIKPEDVGQGIKTWPPVEAKRTGDGIPGRFYTGSDESPVLIEAFDAEPGPPVFVEGKRMPVREAMERFQEACAIVDAYHKEHWVCRTINAAAFFRGGLTSKVWMFPPVSLAGFGHPLHEAVGTPGYIAPEAWSPEKAEPAMDVYALGAVAWAWLAGRHPFAEVSDIGEIVALSRGAALPALSTEFPDVPPAADALIGAATAVHPMDRPKSARDLSRMVRDVLAALARAPKAKAPEPAEEAPAGAEAVPEPAEGGTSPASEKKKEKPAEKRNTRVIPFSLDDIMDATEGK
ncbi:MAG: hypothetical protein MUC63_04170 [Planctomycetes bacterium]|nr:hypothetical protein [Planctomycetota bacterium]